MSNNTHRRPQTISYYPSQSPPQSQRSQRPSHAYTAPFQQDLDRLTHLTLNNNTNTNAHLNSNQPRTQSTQHASIQGHVQRRQPTPWPPSPPRGSQRSIVPFSASSQPQPQLQPHVTLPGTYPTSPIQTTRSIYQPLVAASPPASNQNAARPPTPPPFSPESVVTPRWEQRQLEGFRRWEQEQERLLQHVPPPVSIGVGASVGDWAVEGPYREGSRCAGRVPTPGPESTRNGTSAAAMRRLTPVFATGVPGPVVDVRSGSFDGQDEMQAQGRLRTEQQSARGEERRRKTSKQQGEGKDKETQRPKRTITVRRDSAEEKERAKGKGNREEVWVGINVRVKKESGRSEMEQVPLERRDEAKGEGEDVGDDEWEVVRRPGGVMVDDGVDSDDSDTWY